MKILLHICCAPCLIYPLRILRLCENEITGCFYNPNIHPCREYQMRLNALADYAKQQNIEVIWPEDYDMETFLRSVVFREADRCHACYDLRLRYTAMMARNLAFDGFTTTLLYSKYQKHEWIRSIGESLAKEYGVSFFYHDFRDGWPEGARVSKETGIYRQSYCGCIYSEKERYWR
jgi:predicted adenine nucleotide alpha hydrolase (AANH) superfamily ATPase